MANNYQIININLTSITSDEVIENVPCGSCTTCCEKLAPHLSVSEIQSGLYPLSLVNPDSSHLRENPNTGPIVTLYRKKDGGCGMFIDNKCSIYDIRPIACRQFDCRKGHYPGIPDLTSKEVK